MKKIIFLSAIIIFILFIGLIIATNFTKTPFLARLSLPQDLRPASAPAVDFTDKNRPRGEVSYGNFILQLLAGSLLYLAGPIAIFFIVWGGSSYIISHGKQEVMDKAKKTITFAIIGLLVIIFSYILIEAIIGFVLQA